MGKKILIVGGVAGGATAAARLRRRDESVEIIMFERGEHISFANCGLPYYVGGVISERANLLVQTPQGLKQRYNIDVRTFSEVTKIHPSEKKISVKNIQTGETYQESYDYVLLAPGASPIRPPFPGMEEAENIFTVRNITDVDTIKKFIADNNPKEAVVIGGGFIGLEMVENLQKRNMHVTIVEQVDQIMALLDKEMASFVQNHVTENGVDIILKDGVKAISEKGHAVQLESGKVVHADLIILAIGVKPENKLAMDAGLEIGTRGGIVVDEYMRTSDQSIYAVGDAVQVKDYINGAYTVSPFGGPANRQARIAADNILGGKATYTGTVGTFVCKIFDMTVAGTGNTERALQKTDKKYMVVHIHPGSHAGYYPDSTAIALKILFERDTGTILGAQAVGRNGVDKRIDVIATALQAGLKVTDLSGLQLAYAPPYSSAKDPVNMLGYVAEDLLNGDSETVQWHEVDELGRNGAILLDVREEFEHHLGSIPHSINIPLGELRDRIHEIPKDKPVITYCQVGLRGYIAARLLKQHGFLIKNLDGGYKTYAAVFIEGNSHLVHTTDTGVSHMSTETKLTNYEPKIAFDINACGLQCPGPLMKLDEALKKVSPGEVVKVTATDPAFIVDAAHWCESTRNNLEKSEVLDGQYVVFIKKGEVDTKLTTEQTIAGNEPVTLIVFDGDLDKAIAAFIIANGAAAFGRNVTMFFTFWGLNILRKNNPPHVQKTLLDRMFGSMMPQGTRELGLSKMNMLGLGAKMIHFTMRKKHVDSLDELIKKAQDQGVKLVACSMSMDIMGISKEEFIDGVTIGGVATYLGDATKARVNLFI